MANRIHVVGGSGSGTTTLGRALADRIGCKFLDTDDFYWMPSDPPFTIKRPIPERIAQIMKEVEGVSDWVLSGSLVSWGAPLEHLFTHVVLLTLDPEVRIGRLHEREQERYGSRIEPGGDMREAHVAFMSWAREYDSPDTQVRSRALHERWLARLACPVVRLDAAAPVGQLCDAVLAELR